MADSNSEPGKQSDGWRSVIAGSATTILIAIFQWRLAKSSWLQVSLLLAPAFGQLVGYIIGWPIQYAYDSWDVWRYNQSIKRLLTERELAKTKPRRRRVIDDNIEWYQKKIFELESKSINR